MEVEREERTQEGWGGSQILSACTLFFFLFFPPGGCTLSFITLFSLWHWLSNSKNNRPGWLWPTVAGHTFTLWTRSNCEIIFFLCVWRFFWNVKSSVELRESFSHINAELRVHTPVCWMLLKKKQKKKPVALLSWSNPQPHLVVVADITI